MEITVEALNKLRQTLLLEGFRSKKSGTYVFIIKDVKSVGIVDAVKPIPRVMVTLEAKTTYLSDAPEHYMPLSDCLRWIVEAGNVRLCESAD